MSYFISEHETREVFESGFALVRTGSLSGTIAQISTLAQNPGVFSGKFVSTSLSPKNGRMFFYNSGNGKSPFALIFDSRECLRIDADGRRSPEFWCYPTGYYAKIEHNSDSSGTPSKRLSPYASRGTLSRYDVGLSHTPESLSAQNERFLREGGTPLYNEVYTKVRNPKGVAIIGGSRLLKCQLYIEMIKLLSKGIDIPLFLIGPRIGLSHYSYELFQKDFMSLSAEDLVSLLGHQLKPCLLALELHFVDRPYSNEMLLFTQFFHDSGYRPTESSQYAEKMTAVMFLLGRPETDTFQQHISQHPESLYNDTMITLFEKRSAAITSSLLFQYFIAMSLSKFNKSNHGRIMSLFQKHKSENICCCTAPIFRRGRLRKWTQLENSLRQGDAMGTLMDELANNIDSSTGRKRFLYEALNIPPSISIEITKEAAKRHVTANASPTSVAMSAGNPAF